MSNLEPPAFGTAPPQHAPVGPRLLRQTNNRRIFQCVLREGRISRAEISRKTGISPATVSKVVAHLQEASLVEEAESRDPEQSLGRPSVLYRPAVENAHIIAVVIDPSQSVVALGGLDCRSHEEPLRFQTPDTYEQLIDQLAENVSQVASQAPGELFGVGITTMGQVDRRQQLVLNSPNLHMLDHRSPSRDLQQRTGLNCYMFRDTEVVLLREWTCGQAVGATNFVTIVAEEERRGFGLAAVADGRLMDGNDGLSGELGHITIELDGRVCGCGNRGCLETRATDTAFLQTLGEYTGQTWTMHDVLHADRAQVPQIDTALDETLEYLAVGVAAAINIFNPELILIAASMFDVAPEAFDRLTKRAHERALNPLHETCHIARTWADPIQEALAGGVHYLLSPTFPTI